MAACKAEEKASPAPAPVPKAKVMQTQQSTSKVAIAPQAFDFSAKRDPFKPHVVEVKPEAKQGRVKGTLPIQNFELAQFKISGIIVGLKENIAQVIDPTGKAYTLKKGMIIGNREGRVVAITPTYIEVVEKVTEDSGKSRSQTERLLIPKKN
jgi:type IV pilus assembly protein PilP